MTKLDIFWSFRSPYSYLAVDRLLDIAEKYAVEIAFRPVRPLALREPDFFSRARPQFLPYLLKDVAREAERLGVAIALPQPDPIDMNMATGEVASDQPNMDRLMELGVAAAEKGRGLPFAAAVSKRIWQGEEGWREEAALRRCAENAGLDFRDLEHWIGQNRREIQRIIERNEADQLKHHWGVPLMVLDDEPFFGQDRLDSLVWRLEKEGRRRR